MKINTNTGKRKMGKDEPIFIITEMPDNNNQYFERTKKIIKENDAKIDQKALEDFINFLGYNTPKTFWDIVEKYWNLEIFEKKRWIMGFKRKNKNSDGCRKINNRIKKSSMI